MRENGTDGLIEAAVDSPKVSFGRPIATSRRSGALEHQPSDRRRLTTAPGALRRGPGIVKIPAVASIKQRRRRRLVSAAILCRSAEGSKGTVVDAVTPNHRAPKTRRPSRLTPQIKQSQWANSEEGGLNPYGPKVIGQSLKARRTPREDPNALATARRELHLTISPKGKTNRQPSALRLFRNLPHPSPPVIP